MIPTDIEAFKKHLSHLDWYYDFSDDHRVYSSGYQAFEELGHFLKSPLATDEHKRAYNAQHKRHFGGPSFHPDPKTYKYPYPELGE